MCLAWNKAAVIQTSFRYSLQKGILVSLHVLLLTEFINTTLWVAVESSVVHGYKKFRVAWFQFLEGLCGECWKVMWIHTIPLCSQGRLELWRQINTPIINHS
jgi:hypothetical protein